MPKGDRVTRSAYNLIQSQIDSIMGVGTGQTGYGQALLSRQANVGEVISTTLLDNLRADMIKAYTHQNNNVPPVLNNFLIGPPNLRDYSPGDVVTDFATQYSDFINNPTTGLLVNAALFSPLQTTSGVAISSTQRTTAWGGAVDTITQTVTITFQGYTQGSTTISGADHARAFFNAGGSFQITATRTGGSGTSKDLTWTQMLTNSVGTTGYASTVGFGTFSFRSKTCGVTGTLNTGNTTNFTAGFFDLTVGAGGATLFLSQPAPSGKYVENNYQILARRPSADVLEFTIRFRDLDAGDQTGAGPAVDEEVTGTLTSTITCTRPSGGNVDVPAPNNIVASAIA